MGKSSVVLLLGGNKGDVASTLSGVVAQIEREIGRVERTSSIVSSEAWGFESAPFLNQAIEVSTPLEPLALLDATQQIEACWGRDRNLEQQEKEERGVRYMARTIDIDIIFYAEQQLNHERLTLPHPLLEQREFALRPLSEIAATRRHPRSGLSVAEMLNNVIVR